MLLNMPKINPMNSVSPIFELKYQNRNINTNAEVVEATTLVPYVHTNSLDKGVVALNKMYNHLPSNSPAKRYLTDKLLFLLKPLIRSPAKLGKKS